MPRQPYGKRESANPRKSIRACSHGECSWKWSHYSENTESVIYKEIKYFIKFMPEKMGTMLIAEIESALNQAEKGKLQFSDGKISDWKLRTSEEETTAPVGPVKKMKGVRGVFEISFEGRDYEGKGMEGYRYVRLYFTEPPQDEADLLSLLFDTKPKNGTDIQNQQACKAQERYDSWKPM
jgi:hypothetical protein